MFESLAKQSLTPPLRIYVGSVIEVDSAVEGAIKGGQSLLVVRVQSTQTRTAQPDCGNSETSISKSTIFHRKTVEQSLG
jgi:hypothetical protein